MISTFFYTYIISRLGNSNFQLMCMGINAKFFPSKNKASVIILFIFTLCACYYYVIIFINLQMCKFCLISIPLHCFDFSVFPYFWAHVLYYFLNFLLVFLTAQFILCIREDTFMNLFTILIAYSLSPFIFLFPLFLSRFLCVYHSSSPHPQMDVFRRVWGQMFEVALVEWANALFTSSLGLAACKCGRLGRRGMVPSTLCSRVLFLCVLKSHCLFYVATTIIGKQSPTLIWMQSRELDPRCYVKDKV